MISDAEERLKLLATGGIGNGDRGWIMTLLDHGSHSMMELILLGGGIILSVISFVVVWVKSWIPCLGNTRKPPSRARRTASHQGAASATGGK